MEVMQQAVEFACAELGIENPSQFTLTLNKMAQDSKKALWMKQVLHEARMSALGAPSNKVFKILKQNYDKQKVLIAMKSKFIIEQQLKRKFCELKASLSPQMLQHL